MNLPKVQFDLDKIKKLYPMLNVDNLSEIQGAKPRLLIGSNNAGIIVPLKTLSYGSKGLQRTRCRLGWTVHGEIKTSSSESTEDYHAFLCSEEDDMELVSLVKKMDEVENFGINNQQPKISEEDERALDILRRTIKRNGNRFEVGQIYRYSNFEFPDSKTQALQRLRVMEKKMDDDPLFAEKYCQKIQDYIDKGYARKLESHELSETSNTWYLPHFSVMTANKFRLVMDAKAISNGYCLNDLLLKGPDFVPLLIAVLMRGRRNKIAFSADIQEMFHQVYIRKEDQSSQRFFWRGMNRFRDPDIYVMIAMIFGAVSSPSIAQFVKNFNAQELEEKLPGVLRAILEQHYVDDYFDCCDSSEQAIELIRRVITTHEYGSFKLVKFRSNSDAVLDSLDPALHAPSNPDPNGTRILGLIWNTKTDEFVFPLNFPKLEGDYISGKKIPTKRILLGFMMGVFDPLNMLSPIMIHLKILFQDLWRLQTGWDDEIPDGLVPRWREWLEETAKLKEIRIPRYYFPGLSEFKSIELHALSDASDKAFSSVVYMVHRRNEKAHVAQVIAKSRVAPLKSQTVPRLELQGCVLASQMVRVVQNELKIEITSIYFWTDSKICLGWLETKEKLNAYVGARITRIKDNGHKPNMFNYIPSSLNTADLGTKSSKFSMMDDWLRGPEFIYQPSDIWPNQKNLEMTPEESLNFHAELEPDHFDCFHTFEEDIELPDISRFSNFNRLIRATAYYQKMKKLLALPKKDKPKEFKIKFKKEFKKLCKKI